MYNSINLSNLRFTRINDEIATDSDNKIILFDLYNITAEKNTSINNILISNSSIVLMTINDIIGTTTSIAHMNFTNIVYEN